MIIHNTHAHTFVLDHVPDRFYGFLSIDRLRRSGWLVRLMRILHRLGWRSDQDVLDRTALMLGIINKPRQEDVFRILQFYYPPDTRFVSLSMDMEHMAAGDPKVSFRKQCDELAELKQKYRDTILPFFCADPRNPDVTAMAREYIGTRGFTGIKLYPALGYYPFDIRLHGVYRYALEHDLPIITHCSKGPVYYRGDYTPDMLVHPVTGERYTEKSRSELSWHYTDPRNFDYLMDPAALQIYLDKVAPGAKAPDFSRLKISMGHFGGDIEVKKYLDSWKWDFDKSEPAQPVLSWFKVIRDLIRKYPHFYADISYTWEDPAFTGILKVLLEESRDSEDGRFYERVLFGTDFFLVARETQENLFTVNLRSQLGENTFRQIAETNPERFLARR